MSYAVVTTEGAVLATKQIGGADFDQASVEARCEQANKAAEELEIKTRYEVREQ